MSRNQELCYNRGCGRTFDPKKNLVTSKDCKYHVGAPFFHETYKGWTCCSKQSIDFDDFMNTPGCARGPHSTKKLIEPESITGIKDGRSLEEQLTDFKLKNSSANKEKAPKKTERPDFKNTPLISITPSRAASLNSSTSPALYVNDTNSTENEDVLALGESCKNAACKETYNGTNQESDCIYHSGSPIFHEGLKYWSCCLKKTCDFETFERQKGCATGHHNWKARKNSTVCRHDWHQTATHVTVAFYAKQYDPDVSKIEIHPTRLKIHIYFPKDTASFNLDKELEGMISLEASSANMAGTKIEVKLKKAEAGTWKKLFIEEKN